MTRVHALASNLLVHSEILNLGNNVKDIEFGFYGAIRARSSMD